MRTLTLILAFVFSMQLLYAQDTEIKAKSETAVVTDINRNAVSIGTHLLTVDLFYERIIPVERKFVFLAGGGIIQGVAFTDETNLLAKLGCMYGAKKHFIEASILVAPFTGEDHTTFIPQIAYRYQNRFDWFFRMDASIIVDTGTYKDGSGKWTDVYAIPGISIGYSF